MGLKSQLTSILILLSIAEANNNINDLFGDYNNEDLPCWERGMEHSRRPTLEFSIPTTTRLHADPGERYRAEFLLTKNAREEFTTILSYREKYELDRGNRMPHMQIVGKK